MSDNFRFIEYFNFLSKDNLNFFEKIYELKISKYFILRKLYIKLL